LEAEKMKAAAVNGSPKPDGNTASALRAMAVVLEGEGIETEIIQVGGREVRGCVGCGYCRTSEKNACVFKGDIVEEAMPRLREADGIILAAPAYYSGIPGDMKAFLDRTFFSSSRYFKYKVGTAVAVARRAGGADVTRQLMNFFSLAETVTPPSQYWTVAYGRDKGEVLLDSEGMQTLCKNALAMAWLMKVINASKGVIPLPPDIEHTHMNFIR
jgi:multimeric flavodoxin WrbA